MGLLKNFVLGHEWTNPISTITKVVTLTDNRTNMKAHRLRIPRHVELLWEWDVAVVWAGLKIVFRGCCGVQWPDLGLYVLSFRLQ